MIYFSQLSDATSLLPWDMFAALFPPVYENKFKGVIDEFYVYNCSLTAQQIRIIADTCRDEGGENSFLFFKFTNPVIINIYYDHSQEFFFIATRNNFVKK